MKCSEKFTNNVSIGSQEKKNSIDGKINVGLQLSLSWAPKTTLIFQIALSRLEFNLADCLAKLALTCNVMCVYIYIHMLQSHTLEPNWIGAFHNFNQFGEKNIRLTFNLVSQLYFNYQIIS